MPHTRSRYLQAVVQKSLKFWPVVCLVGARQVGKSTFLKKIEGYQYLTLDDLGLSELASKNPSSLLSPPCIIDEAQKAPALFDAVKLDIDLQKKPGKFILTGSVRFSKRTLIRESLTGRAKVIQLHPFTCAEMLELPFENRWSSLTPETLKMRIKRVEWEKVLTKGGMPGVFAVRSRAEVGSYWRALIESYIYRDLLFTVPKNAKPALALKILKAVAEILALGETPTFARILRKTGGARAQVERHLLGLEDLMILNRIPHWEASAAKDQFLPFDSAFFLALLDLEDARTDAAIHTSCNQIRLWNELLAARQISDLGDPFYYAESAQGQKVHLISKNQSGKVHFYQIFSEPVPHEYDLRFLRAQAKKVNGRAIALTAIQEAQSLPGVKLVPWEQMG
jgi:predicted AAA+ superfamily ATPase